MDARSCAPVCMFACVFVYARACGVVWSGSGVIRCDVVRCDVVRCDVVRCGPVRSGVVRSGPVRCDYIYFSTV